MGHHHSHEPNDFNTVSDMPWFRPWLLVAFLLLLMISLTKGCKNSFADQTYPAVEAVSEHHEHGEATHESEGHEVSAPLEVVADSVAHEEVVETPVADVDPEAGEHK